MLGFSFHLIRPYWLLALIPLAVIYLLLLIQQRRGAGNWQQICDAHLLPYLLVHKTQQRLYWPLLMLSLAWSLTVFALAGPAWKKLPELLYQNQQAQVIALDLSTEMNATDLPPNRFSRAQYKVVDILARSNEGQIGMIAFSSEPFVVSPLTSDAKTIAAMVSSLTPEIMPVFGHDTAAALEAAAQLFKQANISHGKILLITPNGVTPASLRMTQQLHDQGIITSVLGLGTNQGAPTPLPGGDFLKEKSGNIYLSKLDAIGLQKLAAAGGGRYATFSNDDTDINTIMATLPQEVLAQSSKKTTATMDVWEDEGHWLLLPLLPLVLLTFRRGIFAELLR